MVYLDNDDLDVSWISINYMPSVVAKSYVMRINLPNKKFGMGYVI